MYAYAVKHIVADRGPLSEVMKEVRKNPYVYTSKKAEATAAAKGGVVYVIEVCASGKFGRTYALGYKFRAYDNLVLAGGRRWGNEFEYKVCAMPNAPAEGVYFDEPAIIEDTQLLSWLKNQTFGMAKIPLHMVDALELLISDPAKGAKPFA